MTRGHATCFLCGLSAREGALRQVGQLHACADEDGCNKRRADRVRARGNGTTEPAK